MATARKKTAGKATSKGKSAPKAKAAVKPKPSAKPVPKKKPAPKPVKVAAKSAKPAKPAAKPAKAVAKAPKAPAKAPAKAAKPVKAAAKPAPKAPVKVAAKTAKAAKPAAPKGLNKGAAAAKALAEARAKAAAEEAARKKAAEGPRRLVPATAEAKLAAQRAAKQGTGKSKVSVRPAPEVRPLGVLPVESQAKPRFTTLPPRTMPTRPAVTVKPIVASKPAPKRGDDRLTEADLKHFEERLRTEYARIMREMGYMDDTLLKVNPRDAAGELGGYSFHMADAGTDSMEREKAFDLASKEGKLLREIKEALTRLYSGTYGICEVSGKPISKTRLEALPWARLCIEEQEKYERDLRAGRLAAKDE
ncbi:MAG: TraR/DksA C4-type zinc finger protein [Candidatus Eisenbacteria bacterium]|nr:TraR/DksA C4-type zinc finger protein [Candidatus Eisenbacteria bacterium]